MLGTDFAQMEYVGGGGPVFNQLVNSGGDIGVLRPYIGSDGRHYITRNGKAQLTANNTATLRKDDWIALDEAILKVAKPRLRVFGDLRAKGLQYVIPDGMGKTVLQYERQTDISAAQISMDGIRQGASDRPLFDLNNLPLPIVHKDFQFSLRQLMASRNGGSPLDTTTAELAARRVAEQVEMLTLGTVTGTTFGNGSIYGYTNFPSRLTGSGAAGHTPTDSNWVPALTVADVLAMKQQAFLAYHYGPFKLYCSRNWDQYMDQDYNLYLGKTLRQRLAEIENIESVDTVDYLANGYELVLVQQTADVVRAVVGMDITTVQWETHGGMQVNFKIMAILVPQLRADINGNTGLVDWVFTA